MQTKLIRSDEDLRKYVPNALATVSGEQTFFEKIQPHLVVAEQWLLKYFMPSATFSRIAEYSDVTALKHVTAQVVVSEALLHAIPQLDLVLTPNGFGIVSSSNIAPASKERVERLLAQTERTRDDAIEQMIDLLPGASQWAGTEFHEYFYRTLIHHLDLATKCGFTEHRWQKFLELKPKLAQIENFLVSEYFSPVFWKNFIVPLEANGSELDTMRTIQSHLIPIVVDMLKGQPFSHHRFEPVLEIVKKYSQWKCTEQGKYWTSPARFENKKESHGYWF